MEGLSKITRVQALQSVMYKLYEESRDEAEAADHEDAARRFYGMITGSSPAGVGAAHYAAFCNGVIKGLQLSGRIEAGERREREQWQSKQKTY